MPNVENDAAFYEEHYSDWTVHALPLIVYVPMKDANRDEALALVREVLDEAAFDIRVRVIPTEESYLCEPCREAEHWRCAEPGTCRCTEPVDAPIPTDPSEFEERIRPRLAEAWDEAVLHVEPLLPPGVKRDAMLDNPYRVFPTDEEDQ